MPHARGFMIPPFLLLQSICEPGLVCVSRHLRPSRSKDHGPCCPVRFLFVADLQLSLGCRFSGQFFRSRMLVGAVASFWPGSGREVKLLEKRRKEDEEEGDGKTTATRREVEGKLKGRVGRERGEGTEVQCLVIVEGRRSERKGGKDARRTEIMESSFRTRVDRTFGFLSNVQHQASGARESTAQQPDSSTAASDFWSVSERSVSTDRFPRASDEDTGGESDDDAAADYQRFVRLERRGLRRRRDDLTADEPEEEDSEDERRERKRRRDSGYEGDVADEGIEEDEDEEIREMKRMIGRDCTLDFEEEEDEYDKVAVGREGAGDRMYMREISASYIDTFHLPPGHSGALGTFKRDSRANHAAALARLKEDKEAEARYNVTAKYGSITSSQPKLPGVSSPVSCLKRHFGSEVIYKEGADQVARKENPSEASSATPGELGNSDKRVEVCEKENSSGLVDKSENVAATLDSNLSKEVGESCVKTEDSNMTRKGKKSKTVRFAVADEPSEEKGEREAETSTDKISQNRISNDDLVPSSVPSTVPDYVRNPSKYTHYTLEWSDDEDDSRKNLSAFQSFRALSQDHEKPDVRSFTELPHTITFTPKVGATGLKANSNGVEKSKKDSSVQVQPSISFVEAVTEDDLNSMTNEESRSRNQLNEGKTARVFRKRSSAASEDDVASEDIDSSRC